MVGGSTTLSHMRLFRRKHQGLTKPLCVYNAVLLGGTAPAMMLSAACMTLKEAGRKKEAKELTERAWSLWDAQDGEGDDGGEALSLLLNEYVDFEIVRSYLGKEVPPAST